MDYRTLHIQEIYDFVNWQSSQQKIEDSYSIWEDLLLGLGQGV